MRAKDPHEPTFAYDIVRIHSLMIFTDIVEYNIVGHTKAPLLRCFPFKSKLKSGDIITSEQYKKFRTSSNLQFRRLLENSFHSIHVNLRKIFGEKIQFSPCQLLYLFFCLEKFLTFICIKVSV